MTSFPGHESGVGSSPTLFILFCFFFAGLEEVGMGLAVGIGFWCSFLPLFEREEESEYCLVSILSNIQVRDLESQVVQIRWRRLLDQ